MYLNKLFKEAPKIKINGLATKSDEVKHGFIYFALDGIKVDGHDYIDDAINRGAVVIVYKKEINKKKNKIVYIQCDHPEKILNYVVKNYYSLDRPIFTVGVFKNFSVAKTLYTLTGILEKTVYIDESSEKLENTLVLQEEVYNLTKKDVTSLIIEVSEKLINHSKLALVNFDVLISDDIEMNTIKNQRLLINVDENSLEKFDSDKYITYGKSEKAKYRISDVRVFQDYSQFDLCINNQKYTITTKLLGEHSVYDLVASIAVLHIKGYAIEHILQHIPKIKGQLRKINHSEINLIVDECTTISEVEKVLKFVTATTKNKIILVTSLEQFSYTNKVELIRLLNEYCHQIIFTEEITEIKKEIDNRTVVLKVEDIQEAIRVAINNTQKNDTVIVLNESGEEIALKILEERELEDEL